MANADSPQGFRPVRHRNGSHIVANAYSIASAYATDIRKGDPVERLGTSNNIQLAAAGNADNLGVFKGCEYTNAAKKRVFSKQWPASTVATNIVAIVWDDPQIVYEIQCDTLAVTDIGSLADWNAGTGNDVTQLSGAYVDVGAGVATTAKSIRIERIVPRDDNGYGAYAKIEATFTEHALQNSLSGVGGI
jgi:hypothetical protein